MATADGSSAMQQCHWCDVKFEKGWTCLHCNEVLCERCKIFHQRAKAMRHHRLASTEDFDETIQKAKDETFCTKHTEEELRFHCKTCDKLLCEDCIVSGDHREHDLARISDAAKEIRSFVDSEMADFKEKRIPDIEQRIQKITDARNLYDSEMRNVESIIDKNIQKVTDTAGKIRTEISERVQKEKIDNLRKFDKVIDNLEQEMSEITELMTKTEGEMDETSDIYLVKHGLVKRPPLKDLKPIGVMVPKLKEYTVQEEQIKQMIWTMEDDVRNKEQKFLTSEIKVVARDRFITTGITAICPVGNNSAWVTRTDRLGSMDFITAKNSGETCLSIEKTLEIDINRIDDLALNAVGDLLLVIRNNHKVRVMCHGKRSINDLKDFCPYFPFGICVTRSGDILVSGAKPIADGKFVGGIFRLSSSGDKVSQIALHDQHCASTSLILPRKVRETSTNFIVVLESAVLTEPKVYVMTPKGIIQRVINGADEKFACVGLCCDTLGRVVIADRENNELIFLDPSDPKGTLMRHRVERMYDPWCLSPTQDGKIWIGCGNSYIMVIEIK